MAGFDFSVEHVSNERVILKHVALYLKRIYARYGLSYRYKFKLPSKNINNKTELYVQIDGSLDAMQFLERKMLTLLRNFLVMQGNRRHVRALVNYSTASTKGVLNITDLVFSVAGKLGARPVRHTISKKSLEALNKVRKPTRGKLKSRIIEIIDQWREGVSDNKSCVLLIHQAMEDYLKLLLREQPDSRIGFKGAVDKALEQQVISTKEEQQLLRYNQVRNKLQHRQGNVRESIVEKMAADYVDFFKQRS